MYQLQPYRSGGSGISIRGMSANSPAIKYAGGLVVVLWIATFLFGFPRLSGGLSVFLLFGGMVVATIAIPVGAAFAWKAVVSTRLGEPQLNVNTIRIRRGTELECEFVQPVKGSVNLIDARLQLVAQEWVRYTEGTNTYTATHSDVIDEMLFDGGQKNSGDEIRLKANFRIPANAIHNFNYSNNRLQWTVVVKVGIASFPDFYEEYALDFTSDTQ